MATSPTPKAARREFRNIHISDIATYKLPIPGYVSILHRASGAVMFAFLPFLIWMFDKSVTSEISYERFTALFNGQLVPWLPGWLVKLVVLGLMWCLLHHMCAGLRHIIMDTHHNTVAKGFGKTSAIAVLAISLTLTAALGAKLFGLY